MSDPVQSASETRLELKPFLFHAVLWLPIAFFVWFVLRGYIIKPVIAMTAWTFSAWLPDLVTGLVQDVHTLHWNSIADLGSVPGLPGRQLEVTGQVNVLKYCYGIPVLVALSIATPVTWKRTGLQVLLGVPLLMAVQAFGVVGDVLKQMAFDYGALVHGGLLNLGFQAAAPAAAANAQVAATAALAAHGLNPTIVGGWYQFGYLILPPISAVVLWILMNRRFIERLNPGAGRR